MTRLATELTLALMAYSCFSLVTLIVQAGRFGAVSGDFWANEFFTDEKNAGAINQYFIKFWSLMSFPLACDRALNKAHVRCVRQGAGT